MNLPKCIEKIIDNKNKRIECSYSDHSDIGHTDYIDDGGSDPDDSDDHQDYFT